MSLQECIAQKKGMTQVFTEDGSAVPVTVLEVLPLTVTQVKTKSTDGYCAIQVGYHVSKEKHMSKPEQQHLKKNNLPLFRHLKEVRLSEAEVAQFKVGDVLEPTFLTEGQLVSATGKSIGKGFQGNTKRWNHSRGPMSHGSKSHRLPGSIGAGTTPSRVFKGLNMAGNMGNEMVTIQKIKIQKWLPEEQLVCIKGNVPGVEGGYVTLKAMGKFGYQNQ